MFTVILGVLFLLNNNYNDRSRCYHKLWVEIDSEHTFSEQLAVRIYNTQLVLVRFTAITVHLNPKTWNEIVKEKLKENL